MAESNNKKEYAEYRLHLEWLYKDVNSNDLYYDTSTQLYSLGVEVGF